jgi:hypothetical protein
MADWRSFIVVWAERFGSTLQLGRIALHAFTDSPGWIPMEKVDLCVPEMPAYESAVASFKRVGSVDGGGVRLFRVESRVGERGRFLDLLDQMHARPFLPRHDGQSGGFDR